MRSLLTSTSRRTDIPEADTPPRKKAYLTAPAFGFEIGESSAAGAIRQPGPTKSDLRRCRVEQPGYRITDTGRMSLRYVFEDAQFDRALLRARVNTLFRDRPDHPHVKTLETHVAALITQTTSLQTQLTTTLGRIEKMAPKKRTTRAKPATATTRGVAAALAKRDADRSRNGDNINDSGTGGRRQMTTPRECFYTDFLKC
nr:hypothetical protein [Tanacetum cinerariifolium]